MLMNQEILNIKIIILNISLSPNKVGARVGLVYINFYQCLKGTLF